jgi:hypothetical protein
MNRRTFNATAATAPLLAGCVYGQYFDIEWDEEVLLHDGRMIVVHVKRTFERLDRFDRWRGVYRDTEIAFDAGAPWGRYQRKFLRYEVEMIEYLDGKWYLGLGDTSGTPNPRVVSQLVPVLILSGDKTELAAKTWDDVPDFPLLNIMPLTPNPKAVLPFANSLLKWQIKMDHWKNNQRAAGDNGLIIQRHTNTKGKQK